jgi:hypothetical protein
LEATKPKGLPLINLSSYTNLQTNNNFEILNHEPQYIDNNPSTTHKPNHHTPQTNANMTRGGAEQAYAHFKGKDETFIVYLDDAAAAEKWKTDKTIPLAQVVGSFKIFITHK